METWLLALGWAFLSARFRPVGRDTDVPFYAMEKKLSKHPENSAKERSKVWPGRRQRTMLCDRNLVPLLTLGLPTTAAAAIILAAFQQWDCSGPATVRDAAVAGLGLIPACTLAT